MFGTPEIVLDWRKFPNHEGAEGFSSWLGDVFPLNFREEINQETKIIENLNTLFIFELIHPHIMAQYVK